MTREKKEILKRIEEIEMWVAADIELGCGFAPPDAYDECYSVRFFFPKTVIRRVFLHENAENHCTILHLFQCCMDL